MGTGAAPHRHQPLAACASPELFVATLLHEIGHAITGATDLTAEFEDGLTDLLGTVGTRAVTMP